MNSFGVTRTIATKGAFALVSHLRQILDIYVQGIWLAVLEGPAGRGDLTYGHSGLRLKLARLVKPWQGSRLTSSALETTGLMNSRTTAAKSSNGNSTSHCNATTKASCRGFIVLLSLCG
jgi:hypothetical protein